METKITTAEKLGMELYGCMNSAVLDYGDYTVAVWEHCFKGSIAEVYELVETPEEKKGLRMPDMQWRGHSQM